jgi:hypothetical protein
MKEWTIVFFCTWKFAATFPVAIYVMRMSVLETLMYTNIGGIIGAIFSFYFSGFLIKMWNRHWPDLKFLRKRNKVFTKRNRRFVKIKMSYGLFGIVILSPVLLSIPLGAFLTAKYYGNGVKNILWLITGQITWSVIYTVFYTQVKEVLL